MNINKVKKDVNDKLLKKYIDFGHKFLIKLMDPITAFTRHLCILQGKNPDYVSQPVQAPVISQLPPSRAHRNVMAVNYTPAWVKKSFKDLNEHVINKVKLTSLKKREDNTSPLQVVASNNTLFAKTPNAIDELRKELENINLCPSLEIPKVLLNQSKYTEKKVTKDVDKDFGGSFRRSGK